MRLTIIGGAAGVGKTTVLSEFSCIKRFNTGTFFKSHMTLDKRDDVRKGDWSIYEEKVIQDLLQSTLSSFNNKEDVIIDTHFAAKIFNKEYRIGLKESFLSIFSESIFRNSTEGKPARINIVLISTDPYSLLTRRRLDTTRNREIIPSDCVNDLRQNELYSFRYISAFKKVKNKMNANEVIVNYKSIMNNDFQITINEVKGILGGC